MSQPILANLDDIVFEARNKEYGAYLLRKKYPRHILLAFALGTFLVLFSLVFPANSRKQLTLQFVMYGLRQECIPAAKTAKLAKMPYFVGQNAPIGAY